MKKIIVLFTILFVACHAFAQEKISGYVEDSLTHNRLTNVSVTLLRNETMKRMCEALAKDKATFVGLAPEDFKAYHLADFNEDDGVFTSIEPEKVWEGKPNE